MQEHLAGRHQGFAASPCLLSFTLTMQTPKVSNSHQSQGICPLLVSYTGHSSCCGSPSLLEAEPRFLRIFLPESHTATMSELEKAMIAIIDAFHQYSGKEGDKHKLKKSELKELINNELSHFLGEIKDQETVDKVMEALDSDGDAECDFQEFVAFIAMVTAACHEFFEHE